MTDEPQSVDHDPDATVRPDSAVDADAGAPDLTFAPVERDARPASAAAATDEFRSEMSRSEGSAASEQSGNAGMSKESAANHEGRKDIRAGAMGAAGVADATDSTDAAGSIDAVDTTDVDSGLARLDPLTIRPRRSSVALCVIFGVLMLVAAAGVWWLAVRTAPGQSYDDMVFAGFGPMLPAGVRALMAPFLESNVVMAISGVIGVLALAVMAVRKRWWLMGQSLVFVVLCYALHYLKYRLPRPILVNTISNPANSAPSGHVLLASAAGLLMVMAVPRVYRALASVVMSCFALWIGMSVMVGHWHRPSDVLMALLLTGGLALLVLASTRRSGMDAPGSRFSSASVQIVASVMLTLGVLGVAYAGYIIWQIEPGLELGAQWAVTGATVSALVLIAAGAGLAFGLVLAMRQLTAAPLTRLGLVGVPPAPPAV